MAPNIITLRALTGPGPSRRQHWTSRGDVRGRSHPSPRPTPDEPPTAGSPLSLEGCAAATTRPAPPCPGHLRRQPCRGDTQPSLVAHWHPLCSTPRTPEDLFSPWLPCLWLLIRAHPFLCSHFQPCKTSKLLPLPHQETQSPFLVTALSASFCSIAQAPYYCMRNNLSL